MKKVVYSIDEVQSFLGSSNQSLYVINYLKDLGAMTFVVEEKYIDKDYLIDYSKFYARSFKNYDKTTERLHFFLLPFSNDDFHKLLENENEELITKIKSPKSYLGFVVVKPIENIKGEKIIGRTVLSTQTNSENGKIVYICENYSVNFFGIDLSIDSLPFQTQDSAVGACATIAIWTSLNPLSNLFGIPKHSPFEVTEKSVTSNPGEQRNFPSLEGLSFLQMKGYFNQIGLETENINIKKMSESKNLYLFSWDKIPGNDDGRLIEYLMQNFNIEWIKAADISKNDDCKTIRLTNGTNFLSMTLNDEKTNVNLEINGVRTDKFIVKMKNCELNIYEKLSKSEKLKHMIMTQNVVEDAVKAYIRAKLPIIATLNIDGDYHAVVISGYRHKDGKIDQLYIHDDKIGPYSLVEDGGNFRIWINEWKNKLGSKEVSLEHLLIPIYPKIRLTFNYIYAELLNARCKNEIYSEKFSVTGLKADLYLMQIGEYKKFLFKKSFENKSEELLKPFPRFLWIIRIRYLNKDIEDYIYDATSVFPIKCKSIKFND